MAKIYDVRVQQKQKHFGQMFLTFRMQMSIPDNSTLHENIRGKMESTLIAGGGTFHVSVLGFNGLEALSTKCKYLKPKLHIPPMSDFTMLSTPRT